MRLLPVLALVLLALVSENAMNAGEKTRPKVGDKAPSFQGTDDQGRPWKSSEHVGKNVLVLWFFPAALTGG